MTLIPVIFGIIRFVFPPLRSEQSEASDANPFVMGVVQWWVTTIDGGCCPKRSLFSLATSHKSIFSPTTRRAINPFNLRPIYQTTTQVFSIIMRLLLVSLSLASLAFGYQVPRIIQGGMGIRISSWQLARQVSRKGELGVVSGTVLDSVFCRELQMGE